MGASLTALGHVKDAAIGASLHGQPIGVGLLLGALTPLDGLFLALSGVTVLALAGLEWRRRSITRLLHGASAGQAFWLLTLLLVWTGHGYLFPGLQLGGDSASHIVRFNEVARGLAAGSLPDWTNFGYMGEPLLWFTGPLTYVVGGALALLLRDANLAAKLLLFVTHVLAGWALWALLRRWAVRPVPAAVGAACFGGAFAILHLFFYRGETPQTVTIPLFVMLFFGADGLLRGVGRRWLNFAIFALGTAGLILNHQPHAIFSAIYLAVFGAVAMALGFWRVRRLPALVVAGVLGAVASAVAVLPVLFESDWVMIEPEGALVGVHWPTPARLALLAVWHNSLTSRGNEYWAYVGIGLIVLAAAGIAALVRGRLRAPGRAVALPAAACLVAALFLANPVVRDVFYLVFFAAILAAFGLDAWLDRPVLAGRRLLALAGLVVADLASTAVQPVARVDKGFLVEAGRHLEREAPEQRVVQVSVEKGGQLLVDMGPDGSIMSYDATVQRVAGNHNMAATRVHNFLAVAIKQAEAELQAGGRLSGETRAALALFDVGRIVCNTPIANGCPESFADSASDPVLGRYLPVAGAPAVFSPALVAQALPDGLDKPMLWDNHFGNPPYAARITAIEAALAAFVAAEALDPAARTARAIAVRDPGAAAPGQAGPFAVTRYQVGLQSVTLSVTAGSPGYVQLSHPWLPSTVVTLNGAVVQPIRGTIGLMVLPVQAGQSVITLREGGTAARRASLLVSLAGLLAIGAGTLWLARRPGRPLGHPSGESA